MGRLIDADDLIEELGKREYSREKHDFKILIEKQPTAYDVEKVLAELEKLDRKTFRISPKDAIDIVKAGGVE